MMTRNDRINNCRSLKKCMNCAQSIAMGFADITNLDNDTLMRCAQSYGSGMGTLKGTCGAITGAGLVIGLAVDDKVKVRKAMNSVLNRFEQRNGATICGILKGIGTGTPLRDCEDCVADAAEFLHDALNECGVLD